MPLPRPGHRAARLLQEQPPPPDDRDRSGSPLDDREDPAPPGRRCRHDRRSVREASAGPDEAEAKRDDHLREKQNLDQQRGRLVEAIATAGGPLDSLVAEVKRGEARHQQIKREVARLEDAEKLRGIDVAEVEKLLAAKLGSGVIIGWIFTRNQVSQQLSDWLLSLSAEPMVFMLLVAGLLFLLGMVMDATAIMIMLTPLLAPIAAKFGVPDLQFGVVFVLICMAGLITPPVGVILFMLCAIAELPLQVLSREAFHM